METILVVWLLLYFPQEIGSDKFNPLILEAWSTQEACEKRAVQGNAQLKKPEAEIQWGVYCYPKEIKK